jgi:hypothetical protein
LYYAQELKDRNPDLVSKHTTNQKVTDCFLSLIAKGAGLRMWQTPFCKAVGRPTTVKNHQPDEKFATQGAQLFQILLQELNLIVPTKKAE